MAKQSRENYSVGNSQDLASLKLSIEQILLRLAQRLDTIEGLLPDLDAGLYDLATGKTLNTTANISGSNYGFGTMAEQNKGTVDIEGGTIDSVAITNGTIDGANISGENMTLTITDSNGTVIHKIS